MFKNKANQGIYVFAYDTISNVPKTGDAANITANISKDGAAAAGVSDTNPTEIGEGIYWFDLAQAETNADTIAVTPSSTTAGVQVDPTVIATGISADVTQISGDTVAADNLELQYDTTGLTGPTFPANQEQVGNLTSGTAAINTTAESFTKVGAEPETNDYESTWAEDGVYHIVEDDGGATDGYYQFDVGGNGVPVSITWIGYAQANNDAYTIWAYNYTTSSYQQIGTVAGANGTTPMTQTFNLTNAHVGTGANIGKVRFRFLSANGDAFATDRLLCSYAVVSQSVGYANGAIWIDTLLGVVGTTPFVNGTADNPCLNVTDALALSSLISIRRFQIASGSTITLIADASTMVGIGEQWNLEVEGQLVTNAAVMGANISGLTDAASTGMELTNCHINTTSMGPFHANNCSLSTTLTLLASGVYTLDQCYSFVPGINAPVIDFAGVGVKALNLRHWSGGVHIHNMKAGDTVSLEGEGQLIINVNCTGGTIARRGKFKVTDNANGAVTQVVDDDTENNEFTRNMSEADVEIDTATTPLQWQEVHKIKDTATELVRKDIKGVDGAAITSTNTVVGQKQEP